MDFSKRITANLLRRVDELDLDVRPHKCLKNQNIIYIGDLVKKSEFELLKIPNFGKKSLSQIKQKLYQKGLYLGMKLDFWPPDNIEEAIKRNSLEIEKERKREIDEIIQRLKYLENELFQLTSLYVNKRDSEIITKFLGWDGKGVKTLQAIGEEYGITRERVRQIFDKYNRKFIYHKRKKVPLPLLDLAIQLVSDRIPKHADNIEQELAIEGISKSPFRIEGLLSACEFLYREFPFTIQKFQGKRIAVKPKDAKLPKLIVRLAKKTISRRGVSTISDIATQVTLKIDKPVDNNFVVFVLSLIKSFKWLDENSGWFWFAPQKRNRLLNVIKKVLSVSDQIDIKELRSGVSRFHRMEGFSPPCRVLLEVCRQNSWCDVEGTMISAHPKLDWEKTLSGTTEWAMAAILKEYQPVMSRRKLEEKCIELGMNRNTFFQYLSYSPIITKYSTGVYGLRGTRVEPGIIESLKPKQKARKVLIDFGWTGNGKIWLVHKISQGMFNSGVFTIPATMQKFLDGDFQLIAPDGTYIGGLKVRRTSGWSLKSLFMRRGGEPGDYIALVFNLSSNEINFYLGDEELLDLFQT